MNYIAYLLLAGMILYLIVVIKYKIPVIHKENNIIMEQTTTDKPDYRIYILTITTLLIAIVWLLSEILKRL